MVSYFWDSYAVIELIRGSPNYAKYSQEPVAISIFNLVEVYWSALNECGKEKAGEIFKLLREAVVDVDDESLKDAIKFRKENKKRDLSYADCIGYLYAKNHGMKFLTGDKEFYELDKVEFVK